MDDNAITEVELTCRKCQNSYIGYCTHNDGLCDSCESRRDRVQFHLQMTVMYCFAIFMLGMAIGKRLLS